MTRIKSLYRPVGLILATASIVLVAERMLASPDQVDARPMLDASVTIRTISHVHIDNLGDSVWGSGSGSGFLVDAKTCEIWTNHHVVQEAAIIKVFPRGLTSGSGIPARVINSSPRGDLAVLRMERCNGIQVATLGNSDAIHPGEDTFAVGNPLGNNPDSISRGIISHTNRYVGASTVAYLQTDAPINPGNSGGALFNRHGEVVGINTAIASNSASGGNIGIGYALPINEARQLVAKLRDGPPRWGNAGLKGLISSLHPEEAAIFGVPSGQGAIIVTQAPSKGAVAGVLQQHDVIHRIGTVEVARVADALRIVSEHQPGESLKMDVVRGGNSMSVQVTLTDGWVAEPAPKPDPYQGFLGMTLEMWNGRDGEEGVFKTPVITRVQSLGPAHRALIASSQRAFAANGPFISRYRLDVKTVTGVVLDGAYHKVGTTAALDLYAEAAFRDGKSLLLEIQHWMRDNPATDLALTGTAFFKVNPQPAEGLMMIMAELDGGI